ncbi:MAG: hypothetical protein ACPGRC_06990, partial [Salibacteraceae bacterium]
MKDDFPIYSKNYAITNGGTSRLYVLSDDKIIHWAKKWMSWQVWAKAYRQSNTPQNIILQHGRFFNSSSEYKSNIQVGYDDVPGGWTALAYPLNFNDGNKYQRTDDSEITNVDYSTVFMKTNVSNTQTVDYTQQSPYWGHVFNYGAITGIGDHTKNDIVTIYPNPVTNELKMEVKGFESYPKLELQVYSNT